MKIKMLKTSAGPEGIKMIGGIYDVPAEEAKTLVANKAAVIIEPTKIETTSVEPVEVEARPKPNRRKKEVK